MDPIKGNLNAVLGDFLQGNRVYLAGGGWGHDRGGGIAGVWMEECFSGVQDLLSPFILISK